MKDIVLLMLAVLAGKWSQAQYKPVDSASTVRFKIKNLGFNVSGSFTGLQGTIRFDPARPTDALFDVSVDANTVNTDNSMRDDHLRKDSYFDVKNYPTIRFVSTRVTQSNKKGVLFVFGKLTIKNHTKELSFPFTATPSGGAWLFKGSFSINRHDFEVGGASIIADNLDTSLNILAK